MNDVKLLKEIINYSSSLNFKIKDFVDKYNFASLD